MRVIYLADYRDEDGKRVKKEYKTAAAALRAEAKGKAKSLRGKLKEVMAVADTAWKKEA